VLKLSNIKRVGVAPRVGRVGLPDSAPDKAVNVNCGGHYETLQRDPDVSHWDHAWYFSDPVFAEDLVHTLQGDIDRHYIPTRKHSKDGLIIKPKSSNSSNSGSFGSD
jgi:hypothetical protein